MIRTTKQRAIAQLGDLKEHCDGMKWRKEVWALGVAIESMKNDRNEMIVDDIKRIIKRYDEMNLSVSFEERKENYIKAYMEIKDFFNNYAAEENKNETCNKRKK